VNWAAAMRTGRPAAQIAERPAASTRGSARPGLPVVAPRDLLFVELTQLDVVLGPPSAETPHPTRDCFSDLARRRAHDPNGDIPGEAIRLYAQQPRYPSGSGTPRSET
jgi:hypothetical protein